VQQRNCYDVDLFVSGVPQAGSHDQVTPL